MIEYLTVWMCIGSLVVFMHVLVVDNEFFYEEIMSIKHPRKWKEVALRLFAVSAVIIIFGLVWPAIVVSDYSDWKNK